MKKGFTLIELLAVEVILAIIAIIAVLIVAKVVEKARKGAAEASALNYIDAVEKYMILHDMNPTKYPYDIKGGTFNVAESTEVSLLDIIILKAKAEETILSLNSFITVKGKKPTSGTITTNEKGKVTEANISVEHYDAACNGDSCSAEKNNTTIQINGEMNYITGCSYPYGRGYSFTFPGTHNATGSNGYAWLYDYTKDCTQYGCSYSDPNTSNIYWINKNYNKSMVHTIDYPGSLG